MRKQLVRTKTDGKHGAGKRLISGARGAPASPGRISDYVVLLRIASWCFADNVIPYRNVTVAHIVIKYGATIRMEKGAVAMAGADWTWFVSASDT